MNHEFAKTILHIKEAFPPMVAPFPEWTDCGVDDFLRKFGSDFFIDYWQYMYDQVEVTRFLFPYMMLYFLSVKKSEVASDALDYFIGRLDPNVQKETQMDVYVEELFRSLTIDQRKVVCEWLSAIEKNYSLIFNIRGAKKYWCAK